MFNPIDFATWKRAGIFYYFSKMAPTGYSVTANLDVTHLLKTVHEKGYKFFPAYLWLVTKNLNKQTEFRIAEKDGVLGYYDTLTPLYASFHDDDKTFSLMWTEYCDDFGEFFKAYTENQVKYGENHGILAQNDILPPENAYTVSALPWVNFTGFAVHSYENKPYYFPSIEAGQYKEENGRIMMPVSLTCHHAATDGYHVAKFLDDLQKDMDKFN